MPRVKVCINSHLVYSFSFFSMLWRVCGWGEVCYKNSNDATQRIGAKRAFIMGQAGKNRV